MPSPHTFLHRAALTAFFLGHFALVGCAQNTGLTAKLPAGADLQIGGSGAAQGQFGDLRDTTFDSRGNLYTLEGPTTQQAGDTSYKGNNRVQIFDGNGRFLRQFPLDDREEPAHIAVDGQGQVYVSYPDQNLVAIYNGQGHRSGEQNIPGANGLTSYQKDGQALVAVIGGFRKGKVDGPVGDRIYLLGRATSQGLNLAVDVLRSAVPLARPLKNVADISADDAGNFYALADVNSIYVFGPDGKLKRTIGAGTATRAKDGSEVKSSVAVAPNGVIYSLAATYLAKYDATGDNVVRREGVFAWYEPWNISVLALDPSGRLWAASTNLVKSKKMERFHFRPVILRVSEDFFNPQSKGTLETALEGSGLRPQISSEAFLGVAYDLRPFRVNVDFPAATRGLTGIDGSYRVYDARKNEVAQGRFNLPLRDGVAAKTSFSFNPPAFGAYSADLSLSSGGKTLTRVGANFGVTPPYDNLPKLETEKAFDSRADAARQMFAGLPAVRYSVTANPKTWDALDKTLAEANRVGSTVWVQFTEAKDATPEAVRAVAQRFKGRVGVYEIVNEPDLRMKADAYLNVLRPASQIIHQVDPAAKVMGPQCVNIRLAWYKAFFDGGGAKLIDIVSFHDYEGNESIDESHWQGKIAALRALMKEAGIGNMPLWQTERAIPAVRANTFSGLQQAIRINQHDDVLQSLGIPAEHNLHYYLNEGGYSAVPSYLWSDHGPHPAVFLLRTRYALTKGRKFVGNLDFGDGGNEFLRGLRYSGGGGEIVALRTDGTSPQTVRFPVRGANSFNVVDSWGNEKAVPVAGGSLSVELSQLPVYVRVPQGSSLTAPNIDLGRNIAAQASFSYSGETKDKLELLTNGKLETIHSGLPGSNNRGTSVWHGDLPDPGIQGPSSAIPNPPALSFSFPAARTVSSLVLRGIPSDNGYSALLDFDVQAKRGATWRSVASVRNDDPPAEMVAVAPTVATSWASDPFNYVVRLNEPTSAREWRIVPLRTTFGVAFDAVAARAMKETASKTIPPALLLREVEVYEQ